MYIPAHFAAEDAAVRDLLARAYVSASGPCEAKVLCRLAPPGTNPSALAS